MMGEERAEQVPWGLRSRSRGPSMELCFRKERPRAGFRDLGVDERHRTPLSVSVETLRTRFGATRILKSPK